MLSRMPRRARRCWSRCPVKTEASGRPGLEGGRRRRQDLLQTPGLRLHVRTRLSGSRRPCLGGVLHGRERRQAELTSIREGGKPLSRGAKAFMARAPGRLRERNTNTATKELSMKMKLYEFGPTRSIRARWTLQELGADFEPICVNLLAGEHRKPEFLKINPAGKVPVLVDGDLVLTESVAIVLYLAEKYPDKELMPRERGPRAQVYRWLLFAATELEQPLWRISKNTALLPPEKRVPADVP